MNICDNCKNAKTCALADAYAGEIIGCPKHMPLTNYDQFIRKSPEEMAEFLWSIGNNPATGNVYLNGKLIFSCGNGNGWLDWLQQEA